MLEKREQELEKQNYELRKQIRKLDRVIEEMIGSEVAEVKKNGTYIRVRPAPKQNQNANRTRANKAHHEGVARPIPKKVDVVEKIVAKKCSRGHKLRGPLWFEEHYVEDIVPAKVVEKKYLIAVYWDPVRKRKIRAKPKDVLPQYFEPVKPEHERKQHLRVAPNRLSYSGVRVSPDYTDPSADLPSGVSNVRSVHKVCDIFFI